MLICPPVDFSPQPGAAAPRMLVGSFYGMRPPQGHPEAPQAQWGFHPGLDFCGAEDPPTGWPVFAIADGVVKYTATEIFPQGMQNTTHGYGNCVLIEHTVLGVGPRGTPFCSWYGHMQDFRVRVGDIVRAGYQIGRVGYTRNGLFPNMGAHLHFEIRNLRSSTYNDVSPDLMPGNNGTLWGVSGDNFYRPSTSMSLYGATLNPALWFAERGVYIINNPSDPGAPAGSRRGYLYLDTTRAFISRADPSYLPLTLPPQQGLAFGPPQTSPAGVFQVARRVQYNARRSGVAGFAGGLNAPGLGAVDFNVVANALAAGATGGGTPLLPGQTPRPVSTITPDQATAAGATPGSGDSNDPGGGHTNSIIPAIDPESITPPSTTAVMGVAAAGAVLGAAALAVVWPHKDRG